MVHPDDIVFDGEEKTLAVKMPRMQQLEES